MVKQSWLSWLGSESIQAQAGGAKLETALALAIFGSSRKAMCAAKGDLSRTYWGADPVGAKDKVDAKTFIAVFQGVIGRSGIKAGLQLAAPQKPPRDGVAPTATYSLTSFSSKNPNFTKSLTNFYKRLLQNNDDGKPLPSLDMRGASSDFWELRIVQPDFGEFSTTVVPLNVLILAGDDGVPASPDALHLAVVPSPGAPLEISTCAIGKIGSVPAGAAWTIVPPWHAQSGEILEATAYLLQASVLAGQPDGVGAQVKAAAIDLGFMISDVPQPVHKKPRSAFEDAVGTKYRSTTFVDMAAAAFATWTTGNRPNEAARIEERAAKRKTALEKKGTNKRFCPNCSCSSCAAEKRKAK
jgi:hypothetical protein